MFSRLRGNDRHPRVRARGELAPPPGYHSLVSVGVGLDGPAALWTLSQGAQQLRERDGSVGEASFPRTRPANEPTVALTAHDETGSVTKAVVVPELPVAYPHIQRFPDGPF